MSTTGTNLQQVPPVSGDKPAAREFVTSNSTNEAIQAKRAAVQPPPMIAQASHAVPVFSAPPPLLKPRSNVKRSYTSLIAMSVPFSESLLPPASNAPANNVTTNNVTPSPVVDSVIDDTKAVSDLCSVLNADEGVLMTNADAPSLARSTMYSNRSVTAKDIIGAIDSFWGVSQLPSIELFDE
jgi:hypothetical protein